ncbi:MAG: hypothetical protein GEV04_07600 [Actinophytocola sp.]|nr:hypothetical protein [Actinophytocola sp.]
MDFDAVADELYGGPREEFIRRRNARAAEADDRSVAARIKALRKPTLAAWLVNRLARERPDDLAELAALGQELRTAHEELAGGRLRELSVRRRETVDALTLAAREIGREAGLGVSDAVTDQVHATLQAALAGGEAADLVAAGRLATPLDPSDAQQWLTAGTLAQRTPEEPEPGEQSSGGARRTSRTASSTREDTTRTAVRADELQRRRVARKRAERDAETAKARRDEAAATLADAQRRAGEATEEVAELRAKLVKAQRYEKLARNAVRAAQLELGTAERESDRTERALRRHEHPH